MREHDRDVGLAFERRAPRERFEQHARERVEVSPSIHLAALDLLGRDVVDRPRERAVATQAVDRRGMLGEAEVGEERAIVLVYEDVARLHVAVHQTLRMRCVERLGDRTENAERSVQRQAPVALENVA